MRESKSSEYVGKVVIVAGPLCYVLAAYFWPIFALIWLGSGVATYREVLTNGFYWEILANTFIFAFKVTIMALIIGYPVAAFARVSSAGVARIIILFATIPLLTSVLARTYAWFAILERYGLVNSILRQLSLISEPLYLLHTTFAAVLGSAYVMLPLMILTLYPSMRNIDLNTVRAARTLGASPMQSFVRVFIPLSMPGVVSACLLTFIVSLGFFVTPVLLGSPKDRTFPMLIAQQIDSLADFQSAGALSLVFLSSTIVCLGIFASKVGFDQFVARQGEAHTPVPRTRRSFISALIGAIEPGLKFLQWRSTWLGVVVAALVLLVLPYLALVPMSLSSADYLEFPPRSISLRWYQVLISDPRWLAASINSLVVGLLSCVLATVIGLAAAIGIREIKAQWGRILVVVFIIPMMIPTMIYSVAAYFVAAQVGLVDTKIGIAIAHSTLGVPFVVIICATALGQINPSIGRAAQSLGASWTTRLRRITLPILVPSIVSASLVAFLNSFDEVIVSLFVSGVQSRTLPKAMWQASTLEITPIIPAVAVVVLLFVTVVSAGVFGISRVVRAA
jgi:putative spermidine/putrescine transport system permease protein